MAQVINLGQFPRQTTLAQNLQEALSSGVKTGVAIGEAQTKRNAATAALEEVSRNRIRKDAELKLKQEKAKREVATWELDQAKKGIEFGEIMQEMISRKVVNAKDASMKQALLDSEQIDEATKQVKKFAPQLIGDDGKLMLLSQEELLKKDFTSAKEVIFNKVSKGIPLTAGEEKLAQVFTRIPAEGIASLYGELFNTDAFRDNEEAEIPEPEKAARRQVIIKNFFKSVGFQEGNVFTSALGQASGGAPSGLSGRNVFADPGNPLGLE